jgi:cysteine synthase A
MSNKIDLKVKKDRLERAVKRAKEQNIIIPTFAQMKNPTLIPAKVKEELKGIGLWDFAPRNLFRINWHNEPVAKGGGFGGVNYLELPTSLTGTKARVIVVSNWTIRSDLPESSLAFHRQFLPRWSIRFKTFGL